MKFLEVKEENIKNNFEKLRNLALYLMGDEDNFVLANFFNRLLKTDNLKKINLYIYYFENYVNICCGKKVKHSGQISISDDIAISNFLRKELFILEHKERVKSRGIKIIDTYLGLINEYDRKLEETFNKETNEKQLEIVRENPEALEYIYYKEYDHFKAAYIGASKSCELSKFKGDSNIYNQAIKSNELVNNEIWVKSGMEKNPFHMACLLEKMENPKCALLVTEAIPEILTEELSESLSFEQLDRIIATPNYLFKLIDIIINLQHDPSKKYSEKILKEDISKMIFRGVGEHCIKRMENIEELKNLTQYVLLTNSQLLYLAKEGKKSRENNKQYHL